MTGPTIALPSTKLSPRESEICAFVDQGLTATEIAERLGLSRKTIYTYMKRAADKRGIAHSACGEVLA